MPTKADHNRTHRLIVLSSAWYPPLCTGWSNGNHWRKGDHTASPRRGHNAAFSPIPHAVDKQSLQGYFRHHLTSLFGRRPTYRSPTSDMTRLPILRRFRERADCQAAAYSADLSDLDWAAFQPYCVLYVRIGDPPLETKILNAVNEFTEEAPSCAKRERTKLQGKSRSGLEGCRYPRPRWQPRRNPSR